MNQLNIQLSSPDEYGDQRPILLIDGVELLQLIKKVEQQIITDKKDKKLAGKYDYLHIMHIAPPSQHVFGVLAHPNVEYDGRVSVLECECGVEGCWPLRMRVTVDESTVTWSDFKNDYRDWIYPKSLRFEFKREQVEQELEKLV